jgi:dTDP-4-amino-4,6-dideoxygalactose transaminase
VFGGKVIVPLHYGGVACEMDRIMDIAARYGLVVIEEAALAIEVITMTNRWARWAIWRSFPFNETKKHPMR